jgi:hypothetical protein
MEKLLDAIPEGYSTTTHNGQKYGVSKSLFNAGKSIKVYAEELSGTDFISFNFYPILSGHPLKPCEMAEEKVTEFLECYAEQS